MNHPKMTSGGRKWAGLIGVIIAFALPYHIECGFPSAECAHIVNKEQCTPYEVEPWGFSLLERLAGRNVGFAYSSGEDCH